MPPCGECKSRRYLIMYYTYNNKKHFELSSGMSFEELKDIICNGEKVDIECKEAGAGVPLSVYESYSGFANTQGGCIILGVKEDKKKADPAERFLLKGVTDPGKMIEDFWNTINGNKVNVSILKDEDVFKVERDDICLVVIRVPRADYKQRPVYIGDNPYKGTFKRNNDGDYHATSYEVDGMIRDKNPDGDDGLILEYFTMDDIDQETLRNYRQIFEVRNENHVWNKLDNKSFLEQLGGYRTDRRDGREGLTMAGLLMFGKGLPIRTEFSNLFMDYRSEVVVTDDVRWDDRITYDGTWENNLFNFFTKVTPKMLADLKKPFRLAGIQRIDETSVHKAIREAFVNMIIHADYLMDSAVLKIIKKPDSFEFTNPGVLKLPIDDIYRGGNSKSRNPHMQTMLRMVGFGDNAGSGFPSILAIWNDNGWAIPRLTEDTQLNQVTLKLTMISIDEVNAFNNLDSNKEESKWSNSNRRVEKVIIDQNDLDNDQENDPGRASDNKSEPDNDPEKTCLYEANSLRKLVEKQLSDKSEFMKLKMIKAMEILESNPYVSIEEVAVAMKVSSSTAKRYITELKKEGLIERVGPDNGGFWKII